MAEITFQIPDEYVQEVLDSFVAKYPMESEEMTPIQLVRHRIKELVRATVRWKRQKDEVSGITIPEDLVD